MATELVVHKMCPAVPRANAAFAVAAGLVVAHEHPVVDVEAEFHYAALPDEPYNPCFDLPLPGAVRVPLAPVGPGDHDHIAQSELLLVQAQERPGARGRGSVEPFHSRAIDIETRGEAVANVQAQQRPCCHCHASRNSCG